MTYKEFNADGVADISLMVEQCMFYRSHVTGPNGARYELFQEKQHTPADIKLAKKYLRQHFDVESIHIIKETL